MAMGMGLAIFTVSVVAGLFIYQKTVEQLDGIVDGRLRNLAVMAADMTDGERHATMVRPDQKGSADYQRLIAPYLSILRANDRYRGFLVVPRPLHLDDAIHENVKEVDRVAFVQKRRAGGEFLHETAGRKVGETGFGHGREHSQAANPLQVAILHALSNTPVLESRGRVIRTGWGVKARHGKTIKRNLQSYISNSAMLIDFIRICVRQ
ncbi:hypothetical protein ABAC460_01935 [Asticcacaulis sp. AC460]|nr:hypothetical protein ABAC460_01935 [Asticcacaulis sp. AC460]